MNKPSNHRAPDPMAGVVDRLLAQLPGLQQAPPASRTTARPSYAPAASLARPSREPTVMPGEWLGVWARVALGLSLGIMMASWPYTRSCGLPLLGYLGATVIVMLTGMWAAMAAWRYRLALAHVVALTLLLYGLTLVVAELLPRTGYAVDHAAWQCEEIPPESLSMPVAS